MPLPLGTFLPSAGFSFPRSYVYDVDIATYGDIFSGTGSVRFITDSHGSTTFITIEFLNDWYLWSSKMYQLGEIITGFYVETPPSTVRTDIPFTLGWWVNPAIERAGLYLNWFSGARQPAIIDLPVQPFDYWLPRPLA